MKKHSNSTCLHPHYFIPKNWCPDRGRTCTLLLQRQTCYQLHHRAIFTLLHFQLSWQGSNLHSNDPKSLMLPLHHRTVFVAHKEGIEPTTNGLTVRCSTAELHVHSLHCWRGGIWTHVGVNLTRWFNRPGRSAATVTRQYFKKKAPRFLPGLHLSVSLIFLPFSRDNNMQPQAIIALVILLLYVTVVSHFNVLDWFCRRSPYCIRPFEGSMLLAFFMGAHFRKPILWFLYSVCAFPIRIIFVCLYIFLFQLII